MFQVKDRLRINPKLAEDTVVARLAEYHANRDELLEFYSSIGAQRVNADQDEHTVFEMLEALVVSCAATTTTIRTSTGE